MNYLFIVTLLVSVSPTETLLPRPAEIAQSPGELALRDGFAVTTSGPHSALVTHALERFSARLAQDNGVQLCMTPCAENPKLTVKWKHGDVDAAAPMPDEHYSLVIDAHHAVLNASSPVGILRGLETLAAWTQDAHDGAYWPAVKIDDAPRFVWRGLLLDAARHFMPVEVVKRNLDAMAAVKLNVLHWHLTDDQGFRVESHRFPELTGRGAQGAYYTRAQVQDIVGYAYDRGIRVVPEFDMPGHVQSWLVSHPELASLQVPHQVGEAWGLYSTALDPTQETTYAFIESFLHEMAGLFPDGYVHLGGDEVDAAQWLAAPHVQTFMHEHRIHSAQGLQTYFCNRVNDIARRQHKRVVGWDEVLQPGLHPSTTVESWRGRESLVQALRAGHDGLLAEGYYLDSAQSAARYYSVDPEEGLHLTHGERKHLLGGEASQWTELVSEQTFDMVVWPRAGAIAERLWSPASVKNEHDLYRRLAALSETLHRMGLTHRSAQQKLLTELAGTPSIAPLEAFAAALEPDRANWHPGYDVSTPLDNLVDALTPESLEARNIDLRVDALLKTLPGRDDALVDEFAHLRDNAPFVEPLLRARPRLQHALPILQNMVRTTNIALEALDYLNAQTAPARPQRDAWLARAQSVVQDADVRCDSMRIAYLPSVRRLVEAVTRHWE